MYLAEIAEKRRVEEEELDRIARAQEHKRRKFKEVYHHHDHDHHDDNVLCDVDAAGESHEES